MKKEYRKEFNFQYDDDGGGGGNGKLSTSSWQSQRDKHIFSFKRGFLSHLIIGFMLIINAQAQTCLDGYYKDSATSNCVICPAGFYCPDPTTSTKTACVAPQYSNGGQKTCTACPTGFYCPSASEPPKTCDHGKIPLASQLDCVACAAGVTCPNPNSTTTLAPTPTTKYYAPIAGMPYSYPCPAGKTCTATTATTCTGGKSSLFGASSCLNSATGQFTPSIYMGPQTCPTGTYQITTTGANCNQCDAGKSCASTIVAPVACGTGYYSVLGRTKCDLSPTGYITTAATAANLVPCAQGTYQDSTTNTCKSCGIPNTCSETAILTAAQATAQNLQCPAGYYPNGSGCTAIARRTQFNPYDTINKYPSCLDNQYIPSPGLNCTTCPSDQACYQLPCIDGTCSAGTKTFLDTPRKCPVGYYLTSNNCQICPEGSYCPTQASALACSAGTYSGQGFLSCLPCPSGYKCPDSKRSSMTPCPAGSTSQLGNGACVACVAGKACPAPDLTEEGCIAGTYQDTASSKKCKICPSGSKCDVVNMTAATACTALTQYSFLASTTCQTCPTTTQCALDRFGVSEQCLIGQYYDTGSKTCTTCPSNFQCAKSAKVVCPKGTKYDSNFEKCVECADTHICVYDQVSGVNQAQDAPDTNRWCYGKDPTQTKILDQFLNANRLPAYHYQWCIDCNSPELLNQICTFSTNYFTAQTGQNITCPAQRSLSRLVSIAGINYLDMRHFATNIASNPYPYCNQNPEIYKPLFQKDRIDNWDSACLAAVEYFDQRLFPVCRQTYPGFASTTRETLANKQQTPTDTPLNTQYSVMIQRDFGTKTVLQVCPEGQELVTTGSGSQSQGCLNKKAGDCKDPKAPFCHDGTDFKCPRGFGLKNPGAATKKTKNECYKVCELGKTCAPETFSVEQTCPAGRLCFEGSESSDQYVTRPGRIVQITTTQSDPNAYYVEQDCALGYCKAGDSQDTNQCPAGYALDVSKNAHNLFNCHPNPNKMFRVTIPGSPPTNVDTSCTDGYYCPEAVRAADQMIPCEPGTYSETASLGSGLQSKTQCKACPDGKFCGAATVTATIQNCKGGFYCPTRTHHKSEYACPAGKWSAENNNFKQASECSACSAGNYCKEGSNSQTTCPTNSYCPAGSTKFQDCPMNTHRSATGGSSQSDCSSCSQYNICPGGTDPLTCPAGTNGIWTSKNTDSRFLLCKPTDSGYKSATLATAQSVCPDGTYSSPYATECYDCPEGFYCAGGVKTECPSGQYCPKKSSSPQACPAGSYCKPAEKTNRIKVCPAGTYCPASSTDPIMTPANNFNVQGESGGTLHTCGSGYICPNTGSTGPYQNPCPVNTKAGAGESVCSMCTLGKWCPIGSTVELDCPLGYYCDGVTSYPVKCPKGTYGKAINLKSAAECTACDGGMTCSQNGLTAPDGQCDAGYYCSGGSWTPRPDDRDPQEKLTGGVCPIGGYCPKGSATISACPPGTFNSFPGMRQPSDCISCTPGYYCNGTASSKPTNICDAGYYCTGGSDTPQQNAAQPGFYALPGSTKPIKCEAGSFSNTVAAQTCTLCTAGLYCPDIQMKAGKPCPKGNFCPQGAINPAPCPIGTFNPTDASNTQGACQACTPGYYCNRDGLEAVVDKCSAGFYCKSGSPSKYPYVSFTLLPPTQWDITLNTYGICPRGYYCPLGTSDPVECPIGTYVNAEGSTKASDCILCQPGWYCSQTALALPQGTCDAGFYCPEGTDTKNKNICPIGSYCVTGSSVNIKCQAGTYQDQTTQSSCITCGAGYYCPEGSSAQIPCPLSAYCPVGSKEPTLCVQGTYTTLTQQVDISACLDCPQDKFCKSSGASIFDQIGFGNVYDGYVNTNRAKYPVPVPTLANARSYCDRGNYCLKGVQIPCDLGYYCEDYNLTAPTGQCLPGYVCAGGSIAKSITRGSDIDKVSKCPAGQYCELGSSVGINCPQGYFSSGLGLFALTDCNLCPDGYMCKTAGITWSSVQDCLAGFYCGPGTNENTITKIQCPLGSFCPTRSPIPQPCPPGQYQDQLQQTSCKICQIGKYCPYNQDSGIIPPAGYVVSSVGMAGPAPCEPGTYRDSTIDPTNTQCQQCPAGSYCDDYGMDASTSKKPQDCPAGYYCPLKTADYSQNICPPQYYCPSKSSAPLECPPGQYCDSYGLPAGKNCNGGFYCKGKAKVPNPEDAGITGYQCPKGQYCEAGTPLPKLCPIGTYNDKLGADSLSYCIQCPPTKTCLTAGLASPGSDCPAGFYCQLGSDGTTASQKPCDKGYRCPAGSYTKQRCLPGTYQDQTQQSECKICPIGKYCYEDNGAAIINPKDCPPGFYCMDQTQTFASSPRTVSVYSPQPCYEGTWNSQTGLKAATECSPCLENFRCLYKGIYAQSQFEPCVDGYLCKSGTSYSTEIDCPINSYCIAGVQTSCPPGTYSEVTGLAAVSECVECPPGYVCPLFYPSRQKCPAGYYCLGKISSVVDASGNCPNSKLCPIICPIGSYCPEGSLTPLKCQAGTFQDQQGQTSCQACPAGKYCDLNEMSVPKQCLAGMYCPSGSMYPKACSYGLYATDDQTSCQSCPRGQYCWPTLDGIGAKNIQGICEQGYVCQGGSYSPKPRKMDPTSSQLSTYNGPSRRGYISLDGNNQVICAAGTYQPSFYGTACQNCLKGSICDDSGIGQLTQNFHPCPQGKLCAEGLSDESEMTLCGPGQYIDSGSPFCQYCAYGYYIDSSMISCKTCPFGQYCQSINVPTPIKCTDPTQCLGGNSYDPNCSPGLFLNVTTQLLKDGTTLTTSKCDSCPAGQYCVGGIIAGNCTAGYFCEGGASIPTPDTLCEAGYYCEHGTPKQIPCPSGFFRSIKGGAQASDCSACEGGQICRSQQNPYDCPLGYFCPVGIDQEIACPPGSYGARTRLMVISDCLDCPAGVVCSQPAMTEANLTQSNYVCPKGKYCLSKTLGATDCPAGTFRDQVGGRQESDCFACPIGNYCPKGSQSPIPCKAGMHCPAKSPYFQTCRGGYYCNSLTNMTEKICPTNSYCPRGSVKPITCDGRLICNEGSELPLICEAGTVVKTAGTNELNYCLECEPGTYATIQDSQCQNCSAGFICYGRTTKRQPTNPLVHRGEICPKGYYCPEGSYRGIPCPVGTYNGDLGATSIAQCLFCPVNTFNDKTGQEGCRPCGAFATSPEGSATCDCYGNFRTFSRADSSCRCMSGYDFIDAITGMSIGKESGFDNCSPLVFDRCDGANQTRSFDGSCKSVTDCSKACNGGAGTRSLTLGVCTCKNNQNVDLVCNQNCRSNAPKMSAGNGTFIQMAVKVANGSTQVMKVDLTSVAKVYGGITCDPANNCDVKTTEMGPSGGFYGKYGPPSLLSSTTKNLRILSDANELRADFEDDLFGRDLQVSQVDYTAQALRNPVMCLARGDSMLFSIRDPKHYPVYLKDSVMNSNPSFDYGQFLILADQMKANMANNNTSPVLFAFTFSQQGSYIFTDSMDSEQLMIVRVTGAGESCPDPDRFIQPLTGDTVASQGVEQNKDIIIKPDVPLLVGMGSILVVSILTVMIGVAYCLHKGWSLPKVNLHGYRNLYQVTDLDHTNKDVFQFENDFSKYKSYIDQDGNQKKNPLEDSMVEDEDDLDDINLNVHLDLLQMGQDYLQVFGEKKEARRKEKSQRKSELIKLMHEIEQMINTIGSDAMIQGMQLFDEAAAAQAMKAGEEGGKPQGSQIVDQAKEEEDRKRDEERRQKLMQEWGDRDRNLLENAKNEAKDTLNKIKKDLNKNILDIISPSNDNLDGHPSAAASDQLAVAIYDNNDVKSRQNKIVTQIEQDKNLTDAEKESLLRLHNQNLTNIGEMMDAEKRKQELELEKAIKDRVERRKKALEGKYKKEISLEIKEGELRIKEDIEDRRKQGHREVDEEINQRIEEAADKGDKGSYRKTVDDLKRERGDRKLQIDESLNKEQEERLETLRDKVLKKWTAEAVNTDGDLETLLMGQPDTDLALAQLKQQRAAEEEALEAKLRNRRKKLKEDLKQEKDQFEAEIADGGRDLVAEEEYERKKQNILNAQQQQNAQEQVSPQVRQSDLRQPGVNDPHDTFKKALEQIDQGSATSALLQALREQGADPELIERLLREQEADEDKKLQARRDLLRQRKQLKKQQEIEAKKLEEQLEILKDEDQEKSKIAKNYMKDMFKQADEALQKRSKGNLAFTQDVEQMGKIQQDRLVVFNEYASDAMLKRLSNLLMKQFVEREQALKLLVQKYMDARLIEKTNIKRQFKDEHDRVQDLASQGVLDAVQLREAQKSLRLKEENMLREVDLQLEKAHKEEEIRVRGELDKKHADEQVTLRKQEMEDQIRMKKELIAGQEGGVALTGQAAQMAAKDEEMDKLALKAFEENKKREIERKQRALGMHKQEIMKQLDNEMKNKYEDYEELLKRKREEEAALADANMSIRKRLADRKKQIKEQAPQFSLEDLKLMKERHQLNLETLDSVLEEERRRQRILMDKRLIQRKSKMDKMIEMRAKVDVQDVGKSLKGDGALAKALKINYEMLDIDENKDNELLRQLREWARHRQDYKSKEEMRRLAETSIELDPISIKKLITKLDNLEKGLKELRRMEVIKQKIAQNAANAAANIVVQGDQMGRVSPGIKNGQQKPGNKQTILPAGVDPSKRSPSSLKPGVQPPNAPSSLLFNPRLQGSGGPLGNQLSPSPHVSPFTPSNPPKQQLQHLQGGVPNLLGNQLASGVLANKRTSPKTQPSNQAQNQQQKGPHGNMDDYKNFKKFAKK